MDGRREWLSERGRLTGYKNVDVVLFGESIPGWYARKAKTVAYHQGIAERIPGDTTTGMSSLAREYDIYISFGLDEAQDGEIYNSQVLINPEGEIIQRQLVHSQRRLGVGETTSPKWSICGGD